MQEPRNRRHAITRQATAYSIELRERVERLEYIRIDACMRRDRDRVSLIDKQIAYAISEWEKSFVAEVEQEYRKAG